MSFTKSNFKLISKHSLFEIKTSQCQVFKRLFKTLKTSLTDVTLRFSREGITIDKLSYDSGFKTEVRMSSENFEEGYYYSSAAPSYIDINISVGSFSRITEDIDSDDNIYIMRYGSDIKDSEYVTEDTENEFHVIIVSAKKAETRDFTLKTQEIDDTEKPTYIPHEDYPIKLTMPATHYQKIFKSFKNYNSDSLEIIYNKYSDNNYQLKFVPNTDIVKKVSLIRRCRNNSNDSMSDNSDQFFIVKSDEEHYFGRFKFSILSDFSKCVAGSASKSNKEIVTLKLNPDNDNVHCIVINFNLGSLGEINFLVLPIKDEVESVGSYED